MDLSKINFIKSPNHNQGRSPDAITHIILHCPIGTMQGTISTFLNPARQVSAHYVVDRDGSIVQMVDLKNAAWHAMHMPNQFSVGIEMVDCYMIANTLSRGCMNDKQWITGIELSTVADLVASLMNKFNVPLQNVMGHNDPWLRQFGNNHQDPGPSFPWDAFRQQVQRLLLVSGVSTKAPSKTKQRFSA